MVGSIYVAELLSEQWVTLSTPVCEDIWDVKTRGKLGKSNKNSLLPPKSVFTYRSLMYLKIIFVYDMVQGSIPI